MKIRKKGFTLLEILTVLVIVASVMAFGLPAYRRAQEKVAYQAATGLLRDVGASWQLLMQDAAEAGIQWLAPYNRYVQLVEPNSASMRCGSSLSECAVCGAILLIFKRIPSENKFGLPSVCSDAHRGRKTPDRHFALYSGKQ